MQLFRLTILVASLLFISSVSCAAPIHIFAPTDIPLDSRAYTIRHPDMEPLEFTLLAHEMVKDRVPEWLAQGIHIQVAPRAQGGDRYAQTWQDENGKMHIRLFASALHLATVEDLAHILLHEFVHAIKWDDIAAMDLDPNAQEDEPHWCTMYHHELWANRIVIESFPLLRYSPQMLNRALSLYREHLALAKESECPVDTYEGFPLLPSPVFDSPQVSE